MRRYSLTLLLFFALSAFSASAQTTASVSPDEAAEIGLQFAAAPGWQVTVSDPYSATTHSSDSILFFYTETFSAAAGAEEKSTDEVMRAWLRDLYRSASRLEVRSGQAAGVQLEWVGSRMERWFRLSGEKFLVQRCMASSQVEAKWWTTHARDRCEAQFNAVTFTAATLAPTSGSKTDSVTSRRGDPFAGGSCDLPDSASADAYRRAGQRATRPANQYACWETAARLGSAQSMVKLGELFLSRDIDVPSDDDRIAGATWLLVAADRYQALMRKERDERKRSAEQNSFSAIMNLVAALKNEKLTPEQFDLVVSRSTQWKKANMRLFQ